MEPRPRRFTPADVQHRIGRLTLAESHNLIGELAWILFGSYHPDNKPIFDRTVRNIEEEYEEVRDRIDDVLFGDGEPDRSPEADLAKDREAAREAFYGTLFKRIDPE